MIHGMHATNATTPIEDAAPPGAGGVTTATSSASLLPEPSPMLGADMGAEIAALAVRTGQLQQDVNTKSAETQDTIQDEADAAQVSTMHDEASTMRSGAWSSGLLEIGAGAATMGSAMPGASTNLTTALKGGAEAMQGGSTLAGGLSKAAATDSEALATQQKAAADAAQRSGQAARDGQKNASDFVQAAIDFYREYQSTKAEAQAAALHGA
jgi:hypothetical protein